MVAAFDTNIIVDLLRKQREAPTKILTFTEIYLPATAHAHGLKLITRDQHFAYIDFLNVEFWK